MKIKMLMAFVALLLFSAFTADRTITIFMIGDSTMANKPLEGGNQERGWGHVLGGYFSENIRVENHARNGRSSKSFIDEGLWEVVINKVKPGDYVLFSLGIMMRRPIRNVILIPDLLLMPIYAVL